HRLAMVEAAAYAQYGHAVGVLGGDVEVVQYGEDAVALSGAPLCVAQQGVLVGRIEARDRLVQQQVTGAVAVFVRPDLGEDTGELHALLFAAGKRLVVALGEREHVHGRQGRAGEARVGGEVALTMWAPTHRHHVEDAEAEGERDALREYGATARELLAWPMREGQTIEAGSPRACRQLAAQGLQGRGFARAIGADQDEQRAG